MTRDEVIALIQQQLGFRSDQATNLVTYMQLAQQTLQQAPTLPWFLKSERSYIDTTANEERIPLPTDFLREVEPSCLVYVPTDTDEDKVFLDKDFGDQLEEYYQRTTGAPEAYCIDGEYFRIFPTPDAVYRIRMVYYFKAATLTTNIENEWTLHAPFLMAGIAGGMIAPALRDKGASAQFKQWEIQGRALLFSDTEAREHANMDYQMGGPH